MNDLLKEYIEKEIFPMYQKNEEGHQLSHIEYVLRRSFFFARQLSDVNLDMVYTIGSFHDVAHHIDKDHHEILSAQMFYQNEKMKDFFTEKERQTMKEAIEDHRASLEYIPRSIYGKIISTADRTTNLDMCLKRTHAYTLKHFPNYSLKEQIERAYRYVLEKYGKMVYAKIYFFVPDFLAFQEEIESFKKDPSAFAKKYIDINFNEKKKHILKKSIY